MPSRKKDRGKQRKAAKQISNRLAGRASPMDLQEVNCAALMLRELQALGCRINPRNGLIDNPCFSHIKGDTDVDAKVTRLRNFDRGLLSDEERQELAENYVHNYAQDLLEGDFLGTSVVLRNMVDPHLDQQLSDAMVKADIHFPVLHFLNQSAKSLSYALPGKCEDESKKMPYIWVATLRTLVQNGSSAETTEAARLALAKGIGPFVVTMIDNKRELFQSNNAWHLCLAMFFSLVRGLMESREGFLAMISYEGLLPFVAQASCWDQSREDIASESESLCQLYHDRGTGPGPEPLSLTCCEAHNNLSLAMHKHRDVVQEDVMRGALDQIACSPLLSNDPNCTDSTLVGLVRMLDKSSDRDFLFESIIWPLLLEHGYVDAGVIAELIEYGKGNQSMETAETVLNLMVAILGRDNNYEHIKMIDSRYATAVRHGLIEFCIDALVAYGDENDNEIGEDLYWIADGLRSMVMHSKTSRSLRERKAEIGTALDALRKISVSQSNEICSLIVDAIDASAPAICCNCLKEVDRKDLLYCKRCGVECYCSLACQAESYALGHDRLCEEEVEFMDGLREKGLSETELKRVAMLSSNQVLNGCQFVRRKAAEFLDGAGNIAEVRIHFEDFPPDVEVTRDTITPGESPPDSLKCTFIVPVYYGFAEKVDLVESVLAKFVSRRSLEGLILSRQGDNER